MPHRRPGHESLLFASVYPPLIRGILAREGVASPALPDFDIHLWRQLRLADSPRVGEAVDAVFDSFNSCDLAMSFVFESALRFNHLDTGELWQTPCSSTYRSETPTHVYRSTDFNEAQTIHFHQRSIFDSSFRLRPGDDRLRPTSGSGAGARSRSEGTFRHPAGRPALQRMSRA